MSNNHAVVTKSGYQALLAAVAGATLQYTHVSIGDANGAAYNPSENQVALVHETYRAPITRVYADAQGVTWFEFSIPENSPDALGRPSHGFNVYEAGLYGTLNGDSVLITVASLGGGYKASPDTGRAEEAFLKIGLAGSPAGAVALTVAQSTIVTVDKLARASWLTVDGMVAGAPANPAIGATYLVSPAPVGSFAGHSGELAQWSGLAWTFAAVPLGHLIADASKSEADSLRYLKRTAAGWVSAAATATAYGVTRRCTAAELDAGGTGGMITPADLIGWDAAQPHPASGHTHQISDVDNLAATLAGLAPSAGRRIAAGSIDHAAVAAGYTWPIAGGTITAAAFGANACSMDVVFTTAQPDTQYSVLGIAIVNSVPSVNITLTAKTTAGCKINFPPPYAAIETLAALFEIFR